MYVKSTIPGKDKDFDAQVNLKHLSKMHQWLALKNFQRNKEEFSKHACNLRCSTNIKMDIPLLKKEPHIQKYIPITHAVSPQLRAVLDQMLEFGIICEWNESSSLCSNILVTKKKDRKSIRALLDGLY